MYNINRIGPWPNIEFPQVPEIMTSTPTTVPIGTNPQMWVHSSFAGGTESACGATSVRPTFSLPAGEQFAVGMVLMPYHSFNPGLRPFMLDYSWSVLGNQQLEICATVGTTNLVPINPGSYKNMRDSQIIDGPELTRDGGCGQVRIAGTQDGPMPGDVNTHLMCGVILANATDAPIEWKNLLVRQSWRYAMQATDLVDKNS